MTTDNNTAELTAAAIAFAAVDRADAVAYQAARGRFFAAVLIADADTTPAPVTVYNPRPIGDFWGPSARAFAC